ncbi:MAG: hypothetical protein EOO63_15990 [Hymenobacter sp.]|nr:MAG: hypothetical protein EOO63_15990 [Hymenobacter sp.]
MLGVGALVGPKAQGQAAPEAYWGGPVPTNAASPTATTTGLSDNQRALVNLSSSGSEVVDDSTVLVQGTVRTKWGVRKMDARVSLNYAHGTTDKQGHFALRVPKNKLESIRYIRIYYRDPQNDDHLLFAKVPFDLERRSYHITLKEPEPIISGKFR